MIAIQNILVPTDFSQPADAALVYARELSEKFGSRLHLLHVVAMPYLYPMGAESSAFPLTQLMSEVEAVSRSTIEELVTRFGLPADRVAIHTAVGTPVSSILETITDERINLVVMGTHGRGMVEHLLLGSVAERVVRRSPVPVLTVHGLPDGGRAAQGTVVSSSAT